MIASVGNISLDMFFKVPKLPKRGTAIETLEHYTSGGGAAANLAVAVARLGVRARFIGCIGNDEVGKRLVRELYEEGVDTSFISEVDERSGIVVILIDERGERTMVAYRGANKRLSSENITHSSLKEVEILHIASLRGDLMVEIAEKARLLVRDIKISYDPGSTILYATRDIVEMIGIVNILLLNETEYSSLLRYCRDAQEIFKGNLEYVVVKKGKLGAMLIERSGRHYYAKAFDVEVVDTTGAGDVFNAALLVGSSLGLKPYDALVFANAAAGLKVMRRGARSSPFLSEILEFLQERGYSNLASNLAMLLNKKKNFKDEMSQNKGKR
ncbi:MAG: carbohydrate kinase family protein [Thermoprotei archaeon]|nr:MAG: carbohydrate kinase family protein [Thermoprotei archaeon]